MVYQKKYNIDSKYIVDGTVNWKSTGSGTYVVAQYKGEDYFVKRFTMGPRIPSKSIPEPVYSEQMQMAKRLENKQNKIRNLFKKKGLTVTDDHIVIEEENFWDKDNLFVTVTRMIPNENFGFDYTTLDVDKFKKLCSDMAMLIQKIHESGVTHGDLKEKNILIQKSGTDLIPYLIDFDSSYPSDYATSKSEGKPMLAHPVVFSEGYQSPEIAIYNFEDEGVIDAATITNKTDIFTLAIIFHKLWTGSFPAVIGDSCAVGEAVYLDREIKLDSKFNISLGDKHDCKFAALLKWMLAKDSTQRPTAQQVIDALADNIAIDDQFETAEMAAEFDLEPHTAHKAGIEIYTKETLKKKSVKAFKKITEGGQYKYLVKMKDGSEQRLTVDEVIANGFGKAKKTRLGMLWPEDAEVIEFVSADKISEQGILSIEPRNAGYKKFYFVALRAGGGFTTSRSGLVDRGIARYKVVVEAELETEGHPWPEHGTEYNTSALKDRKVVKVEKIIEDGDRRYKLTVKNPDGKRRQNTVKVTYMKIMGFIV